MPSISPQYYRKSHTQMLVSPGPLPNMQVRDHSPSPPNRPRAAKTQSMTLLPSQNSHGSPHGSPTIMAQGRRSPPLSHGQRQRGLPTPPHPAMQSLPDSSPEPQPPSSNNNNNNGPTTHVPRPVSYNPPRFLDPYHQYSSFEMTEELLADIARADHEQSQSLSTFPVAAYATRGDTQQQREAILERARKAGGLKDRQQHEQQAIRHSPTISHTPERSGTPASHHSPLASPSERPSYPVPPRNMNATSKTHTPPMQAFQTRSPDKSLPLQEEPEDDVSVHKPEDGKWQQAKKSPDPTPGSGRSSRSGTRDEDETLYGGSEPPRGSDEGSGTPRSPSASLPRVERMNRHKHSRSRASMVDSMGLGGIDTNLLQQAQSQYGDPVMKHQYYPEDVLHAPRASNYRYYPHPDELRNFMEHPTSTYISYLGSPRPDAPIPPTPHSQTSHTVPPSPSPLGGPGQTVPPFSPVGSPYPFPFTHVRRGQGVERPPPPPSTGFDPNHPAVISEQMARQYQVYAQNNLGYMSDSTLEPSGTPVPGGYFNNWAAWHAARVMGGGRRHLGNEAMSITSSPSHEPISLPLPAAVGMKKPTLRRQQSSRKPPPRVESTQPRETSPEPSTSGEETAGEETHYALPQEGSWVNGAAVVSAGIRDDEADWVDEEDDDDDEDLLGLDYHPSFVANPDKRRRRWETRWDALSQAFQALDRQTDATMVLVAAPSHSTKLHMMSSRSIRRQTALSHSPAMSSIRTGFRDIAAERRKMRARASLSDRLLLAGGLGSPESEDGGSLTSSAREEELKRALTTALGSLNALGGIYDQREARWRDEMRRITEDRERIELLLKQAIGDRTNPASPAKLEA